MARKIYINTIQFAYWAIK